MNKLLNPATEKKVKKSPKVGKPQPSWSREPTKDTCWLLVIFAVSGYYNPPFRFANLWTKDDPAGCMAEIQREEHFCVGGVSVSGHAVCMIGAYPAVGQLLSGVGR